LEVTVRCRSSFVRERGASCLGGRCRRRGAGLACCPGEPGRPVRARGEGRGAPVLEGGRARGVATGAAEGRRKGEEKKEEKEKKRNREKERK
jgi:hypothetical protein